MEELSKIETIGFNTTVYNKNEVDFVVDRTFSEFGQQNRAEEEKTVEQFFVDYEDLFYQIPVEGNINSHEYLIKKSSELYHLQDSLLDIQPLLDEITSLRSQSVVDQQNIIKLKMQLASEGIPEAADLSKVVLGLTDSGEDTSAAIGTSAQTAGGLVTTTNEAGQLTTEGVNGMLSNINGALDSANNTANQYSE